MYDIIQEYAVPKTAINLDINSLCSTLKKGSRGLMSLGPAGIVGMSSALLHPQYHD